MDCKLFSIALLMGLMGCSSSNNTPVIGQTLRTGRSNSSVDPQYIDISPSVSADGKNVVFTSGRNGGTYRIFKTSFSGSSWTSPAQVSSSSGLTAENIAKVSPNASYVLIQGSATTGEALVLCTMSSGACTTVSTTPWGSGKFDFSADSTMFYYLSGTKTSGGTMYIANASTSPTSYQLGTADSITGGFWGISTSSPYTVITTAKSSTIGNLTLSTNSFTSAANAVSATTSTLGSNVSYSATISPQSGSASRFTVVVPLKASLSKTFTEMGTIDTGTKKIIPLLNELHTWTYTGTDEGAVTASTGFQTLSAWVASDDNAIFSLNRVSIRCASDGDSTYGFAIAQNSRSDGSVTWRYLTTPSDLSQAPSVSTSVCNTATTNASSYDLGAYDLKGNLTGTLANHTLIWTSDMSGDPEIFAGVTVSGTMTAYNLSRNIKPQ